MILYIQYHFYDFVRAIITRLLTLVDGFSKLCQWANATFASLIANRTLF